MQVIDHVSQPLEEWRAGVTTRMLVSALTDATQLTIFEQWCAPGHGAPTHRHPVEEVLRVLAGEAEVWIDEERADLATGQSVVIPPGRKHGFLNTGREVLHMHATLAASCFEASYDDRAETSRRWLLEPG